MCVCAGASSKTPCPFCSSLRVRDYHLRRGSHGGVPLFCSSEGERVSKEAAVKTLQKIAELCGQVIMQDGVYLIGGHTLRITGAQHLAGLGIEVYIIQLIGRWGSATVFRYVAEAPLVNITEEYKNRLMDKTIHDRCREMVHNLPAISDENEIREVQRRCDSMKTDIEDQAAESGMLRSMISDDIDLLKNDLQQLMVRDITFVRRTDKKQGKWHPVIVQHPSPPREWRTECGWRFAGGRFASMHEATWPEPQCDFCLKVIRRRSSKAGEEASSSTEAQATSSSEMAVCFDA